MSTVSQAASQKAISEVALAQTGISIQRRRILWGWAFLSPWIIGFFAFTLLPMLASFAFSFTTYNLNRPGEVHFTLNNYRTLLNGLSNTAFNTERLPADNVAGHALKITLFFMLLALPFSILIPMSLASLLNSKSLWGKALFRTLFYMPFIVPAVSAVAIWNGFLNKQSGWLNRVIELFGIGGPDWTNSITWIYPALLLIGIWGTGNAMLVLLAGMQGVPTELYEAAKVDGAGPFTRFRVITIPMISPVIFYNLILTVIGLFRYFDVPYMLKRGTGDPGNSTLFYNIHFYQTAFTYKNLGYGATLAWFLFLIALIVTLGLFWSARYWVYYAGGDDRS